MPTRSLRRCWSLLAALWGGSFVFMRVAVPALGPVPLAFARVALAALALLAFAAAQREPAGLSHALARVRGRGPRQFGAAVRAVLLRRAVRHGVDRRRSSTRRARSSARSPRAIWLGEPLTARKVGGMALGLAGVVVLVGWQPEPMTPRRRCSRSPPASPPRSATRSPASTPSAGMQGVPSFAIACGEPGGRGDRADAGAAVRDGAGAGDGARGRATSSALAVGVDGDRVPHLLQAHRRRRARARADRDVPDPAVRRAVGVRCSWARRSPRNMLAGGALIVAGTALALRSGAAPAARPDTALGP